MVNPFDRTFFRLVLGFTLILSISFSIFYFVDLYSKKLDGEKAAMVKDVSLKDKNK